MARSSICPTPSVGATEQTLLTAVRAEGLTELRGAAVEPETLDLVDVLQKMGAIISVDTDRTIHIIEGVDDLAGYNHAAPRTASRRPPKIRRMATKAASLFAAPRAI